MGWVAAATRKKPMTEQLTFISPAIIERIENGSFVPSRRSHASLQLSDRRDVLSPLAVTKRCIRYEPNVFLHRPALVIQMARALNQPEKKITLVGGTQGSGKTSLVRGLIELMGSRDEQLLWFDVNRHTDFDEIIQFLIQYITYICSAMGTLDSNSAPSATNETPIQKLELLINQVSQMPLLIVLDNVEYIVDAELRFNSYPFKEMLNFLLAFPNIKMVLVGERLPYADMSPNQEGLENFRLEGLPEPEAIQFLHSKRKRTQENGDPAVLELATAPEAEQMAIRHLYQKTLGSPWLLKVLFYLNQQTNLDFYTLNRLLSSEQRTANELPIGDFVRYVYQRLPDQHRQVFQVLCFVRHALNAKSLLALMRICYPVLGPSGLDASTLEDILEHSLLKTLLKISYPPQDVLAHIRNRKQQGESKGGKEKKYRPWYELYHAVKQILYASLPAEERYRLHGAIQDFYLREKGQEVENRVLRIKSRAILAEAKYHGSISRERKQGASSLPVGVDVIEDSSLASKTYLSQHTRPVPNPKNLTLEDYRHIQIPDPSSMETVHTQELTPDSPTFLELLEGTSGKLTLQEQLAALELTEEEKELLFEKDTNAPFLPVSPSGSVTSAQPTALEPLERPLAQSGEPINELDVLTQGLLHDSNEDEQEKHIQKRLAAAVVAQDKPVMVRELVELARYRARNGRYKSAEDCLEKALSLKADAKREVLAEIYRLSGTVHKATYHHNAALTSLSKAAVEIRRLMYEDDTVDASWMGRLGQVYQDLGEIYAYRKQYAEATDSLDQALRWYVSADDESRQAEVYFQLAGMYDEQNQSENAIQHYQKALALDEAQGNKLSAASSLANLGSLNREFGKWAEALDYFQRSLAYDREIRNLEGQLNTLDAMAALLLDRDLLPKAEPLIQQGLTLALQEGSSLWQASFYMRLGQLHELKQDWPQMLKAFQLAYSSGQQELSKDSLSWIQTKIHAAQTAQS